MNTNIAEQAANTIKRMKLGSKFEIFERDALTWSARQGDQLLVLECNPNDPARWTIDTKPVVHNVEQGLCWSIHEALLHAFNERRARTVAVFLSLTIKADPSDDRTWYAVDSNSGASVQISFYADGRCRVGGSSRWVKDIRVANLIRLVRHKLRLENAELDQQRLSREHKDSLVQASRTLVLALRQAGIKSDKDRTLRLPCVEKRGQGYAYQVSYDRHGFMTALFWVNGADDAAAKIQALDALENNCPKVLTS